MKRLRVLRAAAIGLVLLAVAGATAAAALALTHRHRAPAAGTRARTPRVPARTLSIVCPSPALGGTLPAMVYLPPGYNARGARYPVIYFLHGLPAGPTSYEQNGFVASELDAAGRRAIVVAPQGAQTTNSDPEYLDWSAQANWPQAISHDLVTCIDRRYHTIADRYGRALVGLSAGGYGAMNVGLRAPRVFAAVQSWSGYFVATDPSGEHVLDLGSVAAAEAAMVPQGVALRAQVRTWPTQIGFYVGNQDTRFLQMNRQFNIALTAAGVPHAFAVYPGGHQYALWQAHAVAWLSSALAYLAAGQRHRSAPPRAR